MNETTDAQEKKPMLVTRHEAAKSLSLSLRMIDKLVDSGALPSVKIGRSVRFRPSALENLITERERA